MKSITMWAKVDPVVKKEIQRWVKKRGENPKVVAGQILGKYWPDFQKSSSRLEAVERKKK